jgi:3-oxoacyl-[acyl-carrier protein] reductase
MTASFTLKDQTALVTGASRGIGRAIALELAAQGAFVFGTATTPEGAAAITHYLSEAKLAGVGTVLQVTDAVACEQLFESVLAQRQAIHILVNNAGITKDQLAMRMKDDEWQSVIDVNLSAVFRLCRLAMRPMMKARHGRMINITSVVGSSGNAGQANYAATKAGVAGMTRALARELGSRNITVNCVAPGFIDTDMTRSLNPEQVAYLEKQIALGRFGKPEDIASAVAFLAGPGASYVTGTTLHVNGGMYMAA